MKKFKISDFKDQTGKVVVITGSNTGLGYELALRFAQRSATVVMAVRNLDKGKSAQQKILSLVPDAKIVLQKLDLNSLESVNQCIIDLTNQFKQIDILINNAALLGITTLTNEGYEAQFGVNYLGHALLTFGLLDTLKNTPNSRVITVGSNAHAKRKIPSFSDIRTPIKGTFKAYSRSKLANTIFSLKLADELKDTHILSVNAHPGLTATDIIRKFARLIRWIAKKIVMQDVSMGVLPILYAASENVQSGQYYGPSGYKERRGYPKLVQSSKKSKDPNLQNELWSLTIKELQKQGYDYSDRLPNIN